MKKWWTARRRKRNTVKWNVQNKINAKEINYDETGEMNPEVYCKDRMMLFGTSDQALNEGDNTPRVCAAWSTTVLRPLFQYNVAEPVTEKDLPILDYLMATCSLLELYQT